VGQPRIAMFAPATSRFVSEQLSFRLQGPCTSPPAEHCFFLSSIPICRFFLWWQGELPATMDPQLWAWVDRFIYDSPDVAEF